jgi:tripartite-type tricarboxylate transporter receptor subunit TctC
MNTQRMLDDGRRLAMKAALAGLGALHLPLVRAQGLALPKGTGKIVVPFPPGGPTDVLARILADGFQKQFEATYIVENKPGASGNLGAAQAANATANGLTLLLTNTQVVTNHYLFKRTKVVDPFKELEPVSALGKVVYGFLVPASTPESTLPQWIERMRKERHGTYGSVGVGSTGHLFGHEFSSKASLPFQHVPYKGEAPAAQDLLAGVLTCGFFSAVSAKPLLDGGRVKALAVTGESRSALFPGAPTLQEHGFQGFESGGWIALMAPAGTPIEVRQAISKAAAAILGTADATKRLSVFGAIISATTPERFAEIMKIDAQLQAERIKASGAALD